MTNKDVYIAKMKMQLDELDGQMSVLEARAKEAKDDARAAAVIVPEDISDDCASLIEPVTGALRSIDSMKSATAEAWDATVAEMEKVRDAFVHSFSYFKSQL